MCIRSISFMAAGWMLTALAAGCSTPTPPTQTAVAGGSTPSGPVDQPTEAITIPTEAVGPAGTQLAAINDATGTAHALITATAASAATATAAPALAEANAPDGWNLILYEPFADNVKKWPEGPDDSNPLVHQERSLIGGQYMVKTTAREGFSSYVYPQMPDVLDFYATVDARLLDGDPASDYGLISGLDPKTGDYYAFLFSGEGRWAFSLHMGGQWTILRNGRLKDVGGGVNHLAVLCRQNDFTLYVNNQPIGSIHDDRLGAPGKVGLIVEGITSGAQASIAFDDFTVLTP